MEMEISRNNSRNSRKRSTAGSKPLSLYARRVARARRQKRQRSARGRAAAAARWQKHTRDALVMSHLALVDAIASRLVTRLPAQIEADELVSAGRVGLVEAAGAFDDAIGVPFGAYARRRVLGAMLDHLRDSDPLSRTDRQLVRAGKLHHFEIQLHVDDSVHARTHGIDALVCATPAPDAQLAQLLQADSVRRAVQRLPTREAYVVTQYFWEHRQLTDIGGDLGVGEARASQLKKQALDRLRKMLAS